VSALLFSLAHHELGGEPWDRGVFLFRAMMGALLGVLYWARGLGIVVYTHALYNVALLLRHA
jgi:membrane protease YdiL (CAAX protease family)